MKLGNFQLLIIDLNNVHEFNLLMYNLWEFSKKLAIVPS